MLMIEVGDVILVYQQLRFLQYNIYIYIYIRAMIRYRHVHVYTHIRE